MVEYVYDAYGVPTVSFPGITEDMTDAEKNAIYLLGNNNPFRYRGYYFDVESGLYYLNSRYYDPVTGRFINADVVAYLGSGGLTSYNLFAYCGNNFVNGCDPCGTCFHRWDFWNDCEKCGGETLGNKITSMAIKIYEVNQIQEQAQNEVIQAQNDIFIGIATELRGAYSHSYKMYQENQRIEAESYVYRFSTPKLALSSISYIKVEVDLVLALSTQNVGAAVWAGIDLVLALLLEAME